MILPNIQKFLFEEYGGNNLQQLVNHCAGDKQIIFCPQLGNIYSWWIPKSSPDSSEGGWSKMKYIDMKGNNPISIWEHMAIRTSDIKEIIHNQYDCYLVSMNDVFYSLLEGNKVNDTINFDIYIKHGPTFYSTNVTNKPQRLMVKSILKNNNKIIYSLKDNTIYKKDLFQTTLDSWMTVDKDKGWNDMNEMNEEDYEEYYEEWRKDLNNVWYTRREFYNFYGTDDAWDNVDPGTYHTMRMDDMDGLWYTKEAFFQYYGTNYIWDKMNPKDMFKRQTLCNVFNWASYLPILRQDQFITKYLDTYK